MIKSELVDRLHDRNQHLHRQQIERVVTGMLDAIAAALAKGGRVMGRNPLTGAAVLVEKKSVPVFKAGKEMHQRLNLSDALRSDDRP
jgi:integration host factor subunit beta